MVIGVGWRLIFAAGIAMLKMEMLVDVFEFWLGGTGARSGDSRQ